MNEINKVTKVMVKLDKAYTEAVKKGCVIRAARIFKRAMSTEKKILAMITAMFPLKNKKEIAALYEHQMKWITMRMDNRIGRQIQKVV